MRSIFLEGAGWDKENGVLIEPAPMQLVCDMPVIHFRPVEQVKKKVKGKITMQISKSFYCAFCFSSVRKYARGCWKKQTFNYNQHSLYFHRVLQLSLLLLSPEERRPNEICVHSCCRSQSRNTRFRFLDKARHCAFIELSCVKFAVMYIASRFINLSLILTIIGVILSSLLF